MSGVDVRERPGVAVRPPGRLPVEPRIAARWVAVRRERNRRRLRLGTALLAVISVVAGAWVLTRSPGLAVRQVVVRGTGHSSPAAVRAAARLAGQPPMVGVDLGAVSRRVEALPWIARARVRRHWPTTVIIEVTERVPVAQVGGSAGQGAIVDSSGRVLAAGRDGSSAAGTASRPLPLLLGVGPAGDAGSTLAATAHGALLLLASLTTLAPAASPGSSGYGVTAVTRAGDGTLIAALVPGLTSVIFGSTDELGAKLVAMRFLLPQLVPDTVATIDVRVPDTPVLTEGKNMSSVSTTQRG